LRIEPYNFEAEKAILGTMLVNNEIISDVLKKLQVDDFWDSEHKVIYETIKNLHYKKTVINIISVNEILKEKLDYLCGLTGCNFTTANINHYVDIVKDNAIRRQIIRRSTEIAEMAYESTFDSTVELLNKSKQLLDIKIKENDSTDELAPILIEAFDDMEKDYNSKDDKRYYTKMKCYDKLTAGLHKQELTIIGARPAVGKTTFAINMMINLASKGVKVLFISREMAKKQIAKRIISCISKINGQKIKEPKLLTESCWIDISKAIGAMSEWPILINDDISKSEDIFDYCLRLKEKNKLEVLFVDYLGLLTSHKKIDSKRLEIEYISRLLKEIALDLHIPVVCLCQLSRSNDKDNREPKMSDLRESGSIEQDADNVILLHNATENQEQETTEMKIKVIVAKQRNGATGYFKLKYYPNVFKFYDYF